MYILRQNSKVENSPPGAQHTNCSRKWSSAKESNRNVQLSQQPAGIPLLQSEKNISNFGIKAVQYFFCVVILQFVKLHLELSTSYAQICTNARPNVHDQLQSTSLLTFIPMTDLDLKSFSINQKYFFMIENETGIYQNMFINQNLPGV